MGPGLEVEKGKIDDEQLQPQRNSIIYTWGTSADERRLNYPCDSLSGPFQDAYFRGVTIGADRETVFRWLCQMRVAPYSYDWIDNFGRESPQILSPGMDNLALGQTFMTIFTLVHFENNGSITLRMKPNRHSFKLFGDVAVCYRIRPEAENRCRLVVKLIVRYPKGVIGTFMRMLLPLGDLVMMRRQLLNFKQLAEGPQQLHPSPRI